MGFLQCRGLEPPDLPAVRLQRGKEFRGWGEKGHRLAGDTMLRQVTGDKVGLCFRWDFPGFTSLSSHSGGVLLCHLHNHA